MDSMHRVYTPRRAGRAWSAPRQGGRARLDLVGCLDVFGRNLGFALALLAAPGGLAGLAAQQPEAVASEAAGSGARLERVELSDRIEADGSHVRRQRHVALLADAAAVAAFSQVGVPFLESNQEAELTRLIVTKPDGRELDLLASAPRDVAPVYPPDLPVYSDLRVLRAAVPSLATGDRIEFEATVRIRPLVPGEVWTEFRFSPPESAAVQSYELDVPEAMPLVVHVREGFTAVREEERTGGRWIRRWRVAGQPAPAQGASEASGEAERQDEDGVEPDVVATSFATWEEFGRWWASLAPPELDAAVRTKAKELTAGVLEPRERLRAIHRYVAREIRYLALPLGLGRYRARAPAEVMSTGLGDCKDKIRLLASLAAAAGIEIDSVLVGVQRRRRVDAAPSPDPFDHVVARARVGGQEVWMDPTSEMTPMGSLPRPVRELPGVAVSGPAESARAELVTTPARLPAGASKTIETTGAIDAAGVIRARVRWTFSGDDEALRLLFRYATPEQRRQAVEYLGNDWEGDAGKVGAFTTGDPADVDTLFWVEYEAEWEMSGAVWAKAWDLWIPLPGIELDAPPDAAEDPAAARRELELAATPRQTIQARVEVPEGVRVTPPVPVTAVRDFAEYRSDYRVEGRTLVLERGLVIKAEKLPPAKLAELGALRELIQKDRRQEFDIAAAPALVQQGPAIGSADELASRCDDAVDEDRFEEAEPLCRKAVELEPQHRSAWQDLGRALTGLGRLEEAESVLRRHLEIDPESPAAYALLGLVARDRGDLAEAERLLRRQIEVAPLEAFAYRHLGFVLEKQDRFDEATTMYERARKLGPEDEWTRTRLLELWASRSRCAELLEAFAAEPDFPEELAARVAAGVAALRAECRPLAPAALWFERLGAGAERELAAVELGSANVHDLSAQVLTAVGALASAWDAAGRIALERGD
ncbi:MAG: DUF3857 domain-containing protein, partial [Thermoanaerobaculia bacterium]